MNLSNTTNLKNLKNLNLNKCNISRENWIERFESLCYWKKKTD